MLSWLIAITGASKGFGTCVALALVDSWIVKGASRVDFILTGRDEKGLRSARDQMIQTFEKQPNANRTIIQVVTTIADFSDPDVLDAVSDSILNAAPSSSYTHTMLINNSGSLGRIERVRNLSAKDYRAAYDANITSPAVLTSHFLRRFGGAEEGTWIVNVSSLAAVKALDTMSMYATGKAARDMFFRCVALEEEELAKESGRNANTRILSYAPGPMETQMQKQIRSEMPDVPMKEMFVDFKEKNGMVDPMDSARKMLAVLEWNKYENGAHIDVYDVETFLSAGDSLNKA
ncbi:hypothetical protein BJ742DRAFT_823040 [Cladochytrium replicatum]|nr:hypothetical protein BJ742DRAFT_823040 [Cladochytrium replicatum]